MFFFRKLFGLFFFGLLIFGMFGLLGRGGHGRYDEAYRQGFIDGQQATSDSGKAAPDTAGETTSAVPQSRPGANIYYRGHGFFFPGFGLFLCLIPLFMFGLFFMGFGKRRWHGHRHHRGPWGHHGRGRGPCGPGPWGRGEGAEDSAQDSGQEKSPDDIDDGSDEPIFRA
jgi:hypothetical protein